MSESEHRCYYCGSPAEIAYEYGEGFIFRGAVAIYVCAACDNENAWIQRRIYERIREEIRLP